MYHRMTTGRSAVGHWWHFTHGTGFSLFDERELNKKNRSKLKDFYLSVFIRGKKRFAFCLNKIPHFIDRKLFGRVV